MKKILISFFILLSNLTFSYGIQPMYFEKDISSGRGYSEISILNTNKRERGRYKISIGQSSDSKEDISSFVEIYPKVLNVMPDSTGLLKVFVNLPVELKKDEYSFTLQVTPITIPVVNSGNKEISANMNMKLAMNVEMYGHYGEASQDEIEKGIRLENYEIYEKNGKVYLKGTLINDLWYGIVPSIRVESERGTKIESKEVIRLKKSGGKIDFNYALKDFNKKSEAARIIIYDLINYKPLKEFKVTK